MSAPEGEHLEYERKARVARESIRGAFFGHVHPGHNCIIDGTANDDAADLLSAFDDRHWSELTPRELFENRAGIWSLSPYGYRFYLPAFMTAALESDGRGIAGDIRDSVLASLAPLGDRTEEEQRFRHRVSLFTDAERRAVRDFLDAMRAAEGGWKSDPAAAPGYWDA